MFRRIFSLLLIVGIPAAKLNRAYTVKAEKSVGISILANPLNPLVTMISLASAAFGVIAAFQANAAITELFKTYLPAGSGIAGLFIYAIIVTVIAVTVMVNLAKAAERMAGTQDKK